MARRAIPFPPKVAARPAAPKTRIFAALVYPDFRLLLLSNLSTQLGQWTQQVGRGWLIFQLSHSPFQLGLVSFFSGVAMLVAAPLGGVLADRFERRKVILATQLALMLIAVLLALLITTHTVRLWHLYVTALASGAAFSMNGPTRQALVHDLVDEKDLTNAITLNSVTMNSMRVLGPSLGGALLGLTGVQGTFWVQAAMYVVAMSQVIQMRTPKKPKTGARTPVLRSLAEGVAYTRREKLLAPLILIAFITGFFGMGYLQLLPAYVGNVLHSDRGSLLGWLLTAEGAGALIGSVVATALGEYRWRGRMLLVVVVSFGFFIVLLGAVGSLAAALPILVVLGALNSTILITNNILIQTHVSEQFRGRVLSIYFLTFSLAPMGVLFGGAVAEVITLQATFIALGAAVSLSVLWISGRSSEVRRA